MCTTRFRPDNTRRDSGWGFKATLVHVCSFFGFHSLFAPLSAAASCSGSSKSDACRSRIYWARQKCKPCASVCSLSRSQIHIRLWSLWWSLCQTWFDDCNNCFFPYVAMSPSAVFTRLSMSIDLFNISLQSQTFGPDQLIWSIKAYFMNNAEPSFCFCR